MSNQSVKSINRSSSSKCLLAKTWSGNGDVRLRLQGLYFLLAKKLGGDLLTWVDFELLACSEQLAGWVGSGSPAKRWNKQEATLPRSGKTQQTSPGIRLHQIPTLAQSLAAFDPRILAQCCRQPTRRAPGLLPQMHRREFLQQLPSTFSGPISGSLPSDSLTPKEKGRMQEIPVRWREPSKF